MHLDCCELPGSPLGCEGILGDPLAIRLGSNELQVYAMLFPGSAFNVD